MDTARVLSVNTGKRRPVATKVGFTGIDKRPVSGPVEVSVPGYGLSGLGGDAICDVANHGGPDQAVYAYAREDLDRWGAELGRQLQTGSFGENLTTSGVDVNGVEIGERWQVGGVLLEASCPRIPCRTFALWMETEGWMHKFVQRAWPGTYFRVLRPGAVTAGDAVEVVHRPGHGVTSGVAFRALTLEPDLLPRLVGLDGLSDEVAAKVRKRVKV